MFKNFNKVKADMYTIRSQKHQLYTQKLTKIALSTTDDKRFLLPCGIHTVPHGYAKEKRCIQCKGQK